MATVRVKEAVAVRDPECPGIMVALREDAPYDTKDPLVRAYPWAFESDVEQATSAPGEKRTVKR